MCYQLIFQSELTVQIDNQRIIFILKQAFSKAMTHLSPCPSANSMNIAKQWLCFSGEFWVCIYICIYGNLFILLPSSMSEDPMWWFLKMKCEMEEARPRLADNCAKLKILNFSGVNIPLIALFFSWFKFSYYTIYLQLYMYVECTVQNSKQYKEVHGLAIAPSLHTLPT